MKSSIAQQQLSTSSICQQLGSRTASAPESFFWWAADWPKHRQQPGAASVAAVASSKSKAQNEASQHAA